MSLDFICDQCGNMTEKETSKCNCCGSFWFSCFSKNEVVCSKCDVLIESGWNCKVYDGDIFCTNCDY